MMLEVSHGSIILIQLVSSRRFAKIGTFLINSCGSSWSLKCNILIFLDYLARFYVIGDVTKNVKNYLTTNFYFDSSGNEEILRQLFSSAEGLKVLVETVKQSNETRYQLAKGLLVLAVYLRSCTDKVDSNVLLTIFLSINSCHFNSFMNS